jgi:hypothetical protein
MSLAVIHPDNVRLPSRRKFYSENDTKNNKCSSINLTRKINEIKRYLLISYKVPLLTSHPVKNAYRWPWCMEPTVVFTISGNITATRSEVWACGRSLPGIVVLNRAGVMDVCLLWVLHVVRKRSLRQADPSSESHRVWCVWVISKPQQWGGGLGPSRAVAGGGGEVKTRNKG